MSNPNLSNLETAIKALNEEIRKETMDLTQKKGHLREVELENENLEVEINKDKAEEKKHTEEIKKHNDEIKRLQEEIQRATSAMTQLKQQQMTAEHKVASNKNTHRELQQEIDNLTRKHTQNVTALSQSQQDYSRSIQSGKNHMPLK